MNAPVSRRRPFPFRSWLSRVVAVALAAVAAASCDTTDSSSNQPSSKPYYVKAYRPNNPSNVRVKISLANQAIYVTEGERMLMAVACSVGTAATPTPRGNFKIYKKVRNRRRFSSPGAGYPMGFWCEFKPAYGIHAGWVHPAPRTHGCVRIHFNAAPKFFALVREGTPLNIAHTQPEDATVGRTIERPADYNNPEWPPHILNTDRVFNLYQGPLFDG